MLYDGNETSVLTAQNKYRKEINAKGNLWTFGRCQPHLDLTCRRTPGTTRHAPTATHTSVWGLDPYFVNYYQSILKLLKLAWENAVYFYIFWAKILCGRKNDGMAVLGFLFWKFLTLMIWYTNLSHWILVLLFIIWKADEIEFFFIYFLHNYIAVEDAGAPKVVAGRYSSRVPLVHNCNCNCNIENW